MEKIDNKSRLKNRKKRGIINKKSAKTIEKTTKIRYNKY
jgi:hypothetical protein